MNLVEYFKSNGKDIGCNMWEIVLKNDDLLHMGESTRKNTPPRFFYNGYVRSEDEILEHLKNEV